VATRPSSAICCLEPLSALDFASGGTTWLLQPPLAECLVQDKEGKMGEDEGGDCVVIFDGEDEEEEEDRRRTGYRGLRAETPLDWQNWYDFYQAAILPLVDAGASVRLQLQLEAGGELDVNLSDLSVKESVTQFNREAEVEAN
jgi:hypothetical protein